MIEAGAPSVTEPDPRGGSIAGIRIDEALVRALLDEQFPHWSGLPLRPLDAGGNDHRMLRPGDELSVRLPSAPGYVPQVEKEQAWLPRLAAAVPLAIPAVRGRGRPSHRFPAPWSVYGWLEGEPASSARIDDPDAFAADLARFLVALRSADTAGAPPPDPTARSAAVRSRTGTTRCATCSCATARSPPSSTSAARACGRPRRRHGHRVDAPARQRPPRLPRRAAPRRCDLGARAWLGRLEGA